MRKITGLKTARDRAKDSLIESLTDYVRRNGDEMSDYYYNEFGINDEDEDGIKVIKVLDTSEVGCFFARQFLVGDETLRDINRNDDGYEIFDKLENSFYYATYWAFYIVTDSNGNECLKFYCFYNDGVCYQEDSDPLHERVDKLSLDEIAFICDAIINESKK